jgi:hypothetical protein
MNGIHQLLVYGDADAQLSINSPPFMEIEGVFSQEPANCPYPEPYESNTHPQTLFL